MDNKDFTEELYHYADKWGHWSARISQVGRKIILIDGAELSDAIPAGWFREKGGTLNMVFSAPLPKGRIEIPVDSFQGLKVVRGDSSLHPHEKDGELLIEFTYFKIDKMEDKPRRVRPAGVKMGILGDTEKENLEKGGHRAMGESADYYLHGIDTQYEPGPAGIAGFRNFPFWRMGIYGDPREVKKDFIPEEQGLHPK